MPTATRTRPGRFARGNPQRRGRGLGRKPPEPTGIKKMLGAVVPGGAAKKAAPKSKKGAAGGIALAAAAVGMAIKNRDKLQRRRGGADAG